MNKRLLGILVFVASVGVGTQGLAARTTRPGNGTPFPANNFSHFKVIDGTVRHIYTGGTENWDLTSQIDNFDIKIGNVTVTTTGAAITCWGVSIFLDGTGTAGVTTTSPSSGTVELHTPSVDCSVAGSSFLVTCQMPAAGGFTDNSLNSFRYNQ
jgi:hypothetical protein